jgi:hypothetical protein
MPLTTSPRAWALAPLLVTAALVGAGCGGSSSAATTKTASQDAARLKFTQCMRDHGVNISDTPGQGGAGLQNTAQSKLRSAQRACRKYQQGAFGNVSASQRQEFQDAFAKFSSCMRQHGVDVPNPGSGGGPGAGGAGGAGGQLDRNDPKVQTAQKACQSKLPNGGRGGPGGAGPGGGG